MILEWLSKFNRKYQKLNGFNKKALKNNFTDIWKIVSYDEVPANKTSLFEGWGNDLSFSEENKAIIDIYQN